MISFEYFQAKKHYETVCKWWQAHGWDAVPEDHLSKNGIVVYHGDVPACAAWIYQTDSAFALLEWVIANPEVRKAARHDSLNFLLKSCLEGAQKLGFKTIFTTARNESLMTRMTKNGFQITDKGMTNLIAPLRGDVWQ